MNTPRVRHPRLILISGAVASGKTALAYRLADLARARGKAAAVDMDECVATVAGRDWSLVTPAHRIAACRFAGAAVRHLFDDGASLVAVAGSTLSVCEWEQLRSQIGVPVHETAVLLRVSLAEAVRRAQCDPMRGATRDPAVLAHLHAVIDWSVVPKADIDIDTDGLAEDDVARAVWSRLPVQSDSPA